MSGDEKLVTGQPSSNQRALSTVTGGLGSPVYTRRSALKYTAAATTLGFSTVGCVATDSAMPVSSATFEEMSGDPGPVDVRYAPQFYLGNPEADVRVEVVWSMQCQYTRSLYKGGLGDLVEKVRDRNDALIVFHHLSRIKEEVPYSEVLLSLEPVYYGPASIVGLQYFSDKDYNPTIQQFTSFIKKMDIPKDPKFDVEAARASTSLMNVYLLKKEKVTKTPSLFSNGKWEVGSTPVALKRILEEVGYES